MWLLWELQDHFRNARSDNGVSPDQQEVMILCVLSFLSIQVEVEVSSRLNNHGPRSV